jgi:cytochrome c-type biogenesis protein CcmH
MLWIVLAVLAAVVVFVLSQPFARSVDDGAADQAAGAAVYRDQLAEIDADRERGLIGPEEAEAARTEVARRLLQHASESKQPADQTEISAAPSSSTAYSERGLLLLPVGALALYVFLGSPNLPSVPLATRAPPPTENTEVTDLIARVEAQLKTTPNDGRGWEAIAPIYLRMKRYDTAAYAFSQSIRLNGETPARLMGFAEADMLSNKGVVSDAVKKAAERILALDGTRIEPQIWLTLGKEQSGDIQGAIAGYQKLLDTSPKDAPWRDPVQKQIAKLLHIDPNAPQAATPSVPAAAAPPSSSKEPAIVVTPPNTSMPEAIAALPAADQQAMIAGMVEKLATRLKDNADDLGGWLRLIRSYQVLGRKEDALVALQSARKQFAADAKAVAEIDGLAKSLGLN